MNQPLTRSFAAQLARLSEALSVHARWPSPPLGFAVHLFRELHLDGLPELAVSFSVGNLDEAPNLAAAGYWLSWNLSSQTEQERALWRTSLERLSKRDPFPRDRQTFALRPVELLGITLGVVTNERLGGSKADWLRDVLNRLPEHGAKDIWCQALSAYAACLLGLSWPESLESRLDRFNNAELGLLICLLHFPQRPVLPGWDTIRLADACCELLRRCISDESDEREVERLAALHAGLKLSLHEQLESALADSWQLGAPVRDALRVVETLCRKFPAFARILLKRHGQRTAIEIVDEYDVQYLIHALLVLHFNYVVPEEHTPSRGGNPARMDFLLKNERIVVETKMTRKNLGQREVFDELVVDRERYKAHPDCETLVCFVFDPEHLCHNAEALERDLTSNEGHPRVRTFVAPK